jgi:hypothetical protein
MNNMGLLFVTPYPDLQRQELLIAPAPKTNL